MTCKYELYIFVKLFSCTDRRPLPKIVSQCNFFVFLFSECLSMYRCPCNVIACTNESANLADRPTVGYRGEKVLIPKQSMQ
jgi:hypothetical protein